MALTEYAIYKMNFWMLDVCKMLLKHKEEDIEWKCQIDSSEQHHNYWWPSLSDMGYKNDLKRSAVILIVYLIKMQQKWVTAHRTISDSQRQAIEKNITFGLVTIIYSQRPAPPLASWRLRIALILAKALFLQTARRPDEWLGKIWLHM